MHGYLTDSITWFGRSDYSELAVGAQLFQEGYDVWFGNIRGSRNSRRHLSLDADCDNVDFWDFSYTEFGEYDLPAMIEGIIDQNKLEDETSCKKVTYVGHSQGSIMAFYGFSQLTNAS